jgi:hypothetical protein
MLAFSLVSERATRSAQDFEEYVQVWRARLAEQGRQQERRVLDVFDGFLQALERQV